MTGRKIYREQEAIKQLRDFYDNITDSELGTFWEDVIEEIHIPNQKEILRRKKHGELVELSWYDNTSNYQAIERIIEVEGARTDVRIFETFKELLEQISIDEMNEQ